jgi:hypothetical protein
MSTCRGLSVAALAFAWAAAPAAAQFPGPPGGPPGGGGGAAGGFNFLASGQVLATGQCGTAACAKDGSGTFVHRALTFNASTGVFAGSILTNSCPADPGQYTLDGILTSKAAPRAQCTNQTLPAPLFRGPFPQAAPLRGRVGLTLRGTHIYGPFDAGFSVGQVCDNGIGSCPAGTDVAMCEAAVERACGTQHVLRDMFGADCGGHADPFHLHCSVVCEYNHSAAGHSPLVGIMLDGRGIYGSMESTGALPSDLDACGGHFGPVPVTTIGADTYPGATNVYHYHAQHEAPYLLGCFGPAATFAQAKALYPSCTAGADCTASPASCVAGNVYKACTSVGYTEYVLDCPVFHDHRTGEKSNQITATADCPACIGSCPSPEGTAAGGLSAGAIAGIVVAAAAVIAVATAIVLVKSGACAGRSAAGNGGPVKAASPAGVAISRAGNVPTPGPAGRLVVRANTTPTAPEQI